MKIRITFVITCLLLMSLVAKAQDIVWDFATDAQGWHDLGAGRDATASWENGSLKLTYFENSSSQGPQLWFPAIQVEQEFDASNYRYLEISYSTLNWPTTLPTKFLVTIKKSNDELVYAYSDIDPTKNFVSIDIGSLDPDWGTPYIGIMKSVEIELPHTGAAASNPATNWFGSGAHGAYICNLTQMLIDPDDDQIIDIFPAIPDFWECENIAFEHLLTKGAISVTADRNLQGVNVAVTNNSKSIQNREIRIKIPRLFLVDGMYMSEIHEGFIENNISLLPGETKSFGYTYSSLGATTSIKTLGLGFDEDVFKLYPNPNSTDILNITNAENIDELLIYSIRGDLIKRFRTKYGSYNIRDLKSGVYIILIKAGNNQYTKRLSILNKEN